MSKPESAGTLTVWDLFGRGRDSGLLRVNMWIMWAKLHKVRLCLVIIDYNEPI